MNAQLEKAIQEAMAELDRISNEDKPISDVESTHSESKAVDVKNKNEDKKKAGRLRSSRQT